MQLNVDSRRSAFDAVLLAPNHSNIDYGAIRGSRKLGHLDTRMTMAISAALMRAGVWKG